MQVRYVDAINEALHKIMRKDSKVFVIGQGVTSPWYVGGTCKGLLETFGMDRVIDTPVSENAVTGLAVGAAVMGMKPIVVFPRMDFMLYAMDPIINQAAKWSYMFGGAMSVPLVIWAIINRKGSQGSQHSQDFAWIFDEIPGLKVVRPTNAQEAVGYLKWAVDEPNPVIFVDNRELYETVGEVSYVKKIPKYLRPYPFCPAPASESLERRFYDEVESSIY